MSVPTANFCSAVLGPSGAQLKGLPFSPFALAAPEHTEAAVTAAPNSWAFPLRCQGISPSCSSDPPEGTVPTLGL